MRLSCFVVSGTALDIGRVGLGAGCALTLTRGPMEQTYQDLGKRIVQAARMATAMHLQLFPEPRRQRDSGQGSNACDFTEEVPAARTGEGKGDRNHLPERPEGCCAQKGPDPFFSPAS